MKHIIISALVLSFTLFPIQDVKIKGKYKIEYDYSYGSQNGTITFDGDAYVRKQIDGRKVKGNIDYQQYFIFLNDNKSHLQVKFPKREISNDTIYFRTIDLNDKSVNNDPLTLYAGKLIKIK